MLWVFDRGAGQCADGAECRLRAVQTETEIFVGVRGEDVGRLMPLRIPAGADLRAALVLAQADRGNQIDERPGVSIRHVTPDDGGIVGRVLFVRHLEQPRELLALWG